ncbi:MAG: hypothetical protein Q9166_003755 [cf. Caloplaca sp. 2 TL-2023]
MTPQLGMMMPRMAMMAPYMGMMAPRTAAVVVPRIAMAMRPMGTRACPPWRASRRAYSSEAPSDITARVESLETNAFLLILCLVGLAGSSYASYYWFLGKGATQRSNKERHGKDIRKQLKDLQYLASDLQKEVQKNNPQFRPGQSARDAERAQIDLESEFRDAVWESEAPVKKADIDSKDPVERLATQFKDSKNKEGLKVAWDKKSDYEQEKARKMVRNSMAVYGITWPKKGNPFDD